MARPCRPSSACCRCRSGSRCTRSALPGARPAPARTIRERLAIHPVCGHPGAGRPAPEGGATVKDAPLDPRAAVTFRYDRIRGACSGILDTGWGTFALLVAVRVYDASPNMKALLVAAGPIGLMLTPIV